MSRRGRNIWLLALAVALLLAPAQSSAAPVDPPKPPVLLVFHSGAFVFGDTSDVREATDRATELGFDAVAVDYPLQDLPGAVRTAMTTAEPYRSQGRTVYAYGESAGGTLASLLSERGLVDAAATYSQITSLPRFVAHAPDPSFAQAAMHASDRQLRRFSPGAGEARSPILALVPDQDDRYLNAPTLAWAARDGLVRAKPVAGDHVGYSDPAVYSRNMRGAVRWLAARARIG